MISAEAKEALYDKPAWSEEDEASTVILNGLCDLAIAEYDEDSTESPMKAQFVKTKNWLKSLKDRMKGG